MPKEQTQLSGSTRGEVIQFRIPGDTRYVAMVRRGIRSIADSIDLAEDVTADIELSVSEAIANAIEHGSPDKSANVVLVSCRLDSDKLVIDVHDEGPGFEPGPDQRSHPSVMSERGRGIRLICELMDSVDYQTTRRGCRVRTVKKTTRRSKPTSMAA